MDPFLAAQLAVDSFTTVGGADLAAGGSHLGSDRVQLIQDHGIRLDTRTGIGQAALAANSAGLLPPADTAGSVEVARHSCRCPPGWNLLPMGCGGLAGGPGVGSGPVVARAGGGRACSMEREVLGVPCEWS